MNDLLNTIENMPPMLSGTELTSALTVLPEYNDAIRYENQAVRLMGLTDIYSIYLPSAMSVEIYNKLYLSLIRSLQKKTSKLVVIQRNQNHIGIKSQNYNGIIGGSDSFTIIGCSGIGKSSAISRAIDLITENRIIEVAKPYTKIIPCLMVQVPFDSSVKSMLLEILRKVDEYIGTDYYSKAIKNRTTTDLLIGMVSSVALNHIGLLVCDEIQNVVNSKNGKSLVGALTQLINNSGISICMVGTPESIMFFEQAMQLARRSVGLQYSTMPYDAYFHSFCKAVFSYQYVQEKSEITPATIEWLYQHSAGVVSVVVSLIHDAQEIAILTGQEVLNLETLNQAYKQRLSLLHGYIQPTIVHNKQTTRTKARKNPAVTLTNTADKNIKDNANISISDLVAQAKNENLNIVVLLKEHFIVTEVAV